MMQAFTMDELRTVDRWLVDRIASLEQRQIMLESDPTSANGKWLKVQINVFQGHHFILANALEDYDAQESRS